MWSASTRGTGGCGLTMCEGVATFRRLTVTVGQGFLEWGIETVLHGIAVGVWHFVGVALFMGVYTVQVALYGDTET